MSNRPGSYQQTNSTSPTLFPSLMVCCAELGQILKRIQLLLLVFWFCPLSFLSEADFASVIAFNLTKKMIALLAADSDHCSLNPT